MNRKGQSNICWCAVCPVTRESAVEERLVWLSWVRGKDAAWWSKDACSGQRASRQWLCEAGVGGGWWWVGDDSGGPWVRGGPSLVSGLTLGRQLRILNQLWSVQSEVRLLRTQCHRVNQINQISIEFRKLIERENHQFYWQPLFDTIFSSYLVKCILNIERVN